MSKHEKLLIKARNNPQDISFSEFKTLLSQCGWVEDHQTGSHSIWYSLTLDRMTIQNKNGMAKAYQIKQFLALLDRRQSNE